ncbi:MAG: hypothetical protein ACU85U_18770, partial [Gammaproteobacteria bacterium]
MSRNHIVLVIAVLALSAAVATKADEIVLANGAPSGNYTVLIGDKKQWDTPVGAEPGSSASGYLKTAYDTANKALDAHWNGEGEAQFFIANDGPADYSELLEQDAGLVILMQVIAPP